MIETLNSRLSSQVLHLASWPPLHQLLQDSAPHTARICALLARRPSVGMLIPLMLGMPTDIAYPLLEKLHANGHIYLVSALPCDQPSLLSAESVQFHELLPVTSFLARLWQRLISAH